MKKEVAETIAPLLGKKCCRVRVGEFESLSLGFGKKVYHHNPKLGDTYYGEWEVGTYSCAWRIMQGDRILAGKGDAIENNQVFTRKVRRINFGKVIAIEQPTKVDVRFSFDSGIVIDFLASISENDEYFHIFCPNDIYVELSREGKWTISRTSSPVSRRRK